MRKQYIQARNIGNNFALFFFNFPWVIGSTKLPCPGRCISESQVFLPPLFLRKRVNLLQLSRKHTTFYFMCTADFHTPSLPHLIVLVIIRLKTIGWGKIVLQGNSLDIFDSQKHGGSTHYLDYDMHTWCVQNI